MDVRRMSARIVSHSSLGSSFVWVLLFLPSCTFVPTCSHLTRVHVTWNGVEVLGSSVLIFHDEIRIVTSHQQSIDELNTSHLLVCSSQSSVGVSWHFADSSAVPDAPASVFQQLRVTSDSSSLAVLSRASEAEDASTRSSGLWLCRLNGSLSSEVAVGLYRRNDGGGTINTAVTLLVASLTDFMASTPHFTIIGKTVGGPPTHYRWTLDGKVLTNSAASVNITIAAIPQNVVRRYRDSIFESALRIMGKQPGLYQYTATNRISDTLTGTILIEAAQTPAHFTAEQVSEDRVEVSWVAPPIPPREGHLILVHRLENSSTQAHEAASSPYTLHLQPNTYEIQLRALSEHYPSNTVGPVRITVKNLLPPIVTFLSLTPTSAEVSFTQPEDSLPADDYVISLTLSGTEKSIEERLEGEEGEEEKDGVVVDGKSPLMGFDSLTEFSTYDLVVTTTNRAYRAKRSTRIKFATPSSVPTSPPESITFSQTSRDVIVSWSPINCSKCSGPITKYVVDFHSTDTGALTLGMVLDETFVAVGLIPHTSYTFRVAGMNNNGTGPYSDPITITTDTETPGPISGLEVLSSPSNSSVTITWDAPAEPNGVLLHYQVTYRFNNSQLVTVNTTDLRTNFTISSIPFGTRISNISVSAYTSMGQGIPVVLDETVTLDGQGGVNIAIIIGAVSFLLILAVIFFLVMVVVSRLHCGCPKFLSNPDVEDADDIKIEPTLEAFPEDTYAIEGEGLLLPVCMKGNPKPSITWLFEGTDLTLDSSVEVQQDGSLFIPYVQLKHTGLYRLIIKNPIGQVDKTFNLFVKLKEIRRMTLTFDGTVLKPIPLAEFGPYVAENHALDNLGFKNQFQNLFSGQQYSKFIGTHSKNVKLNRYINIVVYDHNRIALNVMEGCEEWTRDYANWTRDYINACYIDGFSQQRQYIATQGPSAETIIDFWRMIWQERPPTIVMLTALREGTKVKCDRYWPEGGSAFYGPFKVTLIEEEVLADYSVRTLFIQLLRDNSQNWEVKHFQFLSWTDYGTPDYTAIILFLKDVKKWHQNVTGPLAIHCSGGVGRTGTFICLDSVLDQIKKERVVNIAGFINKMRHQRMKMVNQLDQYIFIHDVILKATTCGGTEVFTANFKRILKRWTKVEADKNLSMLGKQFMVLSQMTPTEKDMVCDVALGHPDRNRSTQHLPADKYRVRLVGESPDYIHAVYLNGYCKKKAYIISEGPMGNTIRNWYKMICDNKCGAVVMLSKLIENGRECSVRYWPHEKITMFKEYRVHVIDEQHHGGVITRIMKVLNTKTRQFHHLLQFHITCWRSDGYCSSTDCILEVINEVISIQKKTGDTPILVHCSDTVTRSAMFCAILTVIDRWKADGVADIFQVIKDLRVHKPGAIPTLNLYQTVYNIVESYLSSNSSRADMQTYPPSPLPPEPLGDSRSPSMLCLVGVYPSAVDDLHPSPSKISPPKSKSRTSAAFRLCSPSPSRGGGATPSAACNSLLSIASQLSDARPSTLGDSNPSNPSISLALGKNDDAPEGGDSDALLLEEDTSPQTSAPVVAASRPSTKSSGTQLGDSQQITVLPVNRPSVLSSSRKFRPYKRSSHPITVLPVQSDGRPSAAGPAGESTAPSNRSISTDCGFPTPLCNGDPLTVTGDWDQRGIESLLNNSPHLHMGLETLEPSASPAQST